MKQRLVVPIMGQKTPDPTPPIMRINSVFHVTRPALKTTSFKLIPPSFYAGFCLTKTSELLSGLTKLLQSHRSVFTA